MFFFFQAEDGIRDFCLSRGLGDVYKRQVYHLSEQCNYLDLSIKSIKWSQVGASRNKDGRKYHACYCAADKKTEGSTVFITDYGMNYHGKLGCSKLKRTVHKVHKSEVNGKNLCSKCKGEGT